MNVHTSIQTAQITCVTKADRFSPHERISQLGGTAGGGWKLSQEEVIRLIEAKQWQFFVSVGGHTVWLVVAVSRFGNKYVKTTADGDQPDNLLSLPQCP